MTPGPGANRGGLEPAGFAGLVPGNMIATAIVTEHLALEKQVDPVFDTLNPRVTLFANPVIMAEDCRERRRRAIVSRDRLVISP